MIDVTIAVVEDATRVKLQAVTRNANWYWAIIKLINQSPAVPLLNVTKWGHFKTPPILFACVRNSWNRRSVWVVCVSLDAFNLHIGIRALQETTITSISKSISRAINHLLGRQSHKKPKLINRIQRSHHIRSRKRITSPTNPLVPYFPRMNRPVNHRRTIIAWTWIYNLPRVCWSYQARLRRTCEF